MRKQSEYIADWEPLLIECPFCKYPLASKQHMECKGCGNNLKHFYVFEYFLETSEEAIQRQHEMRDKEREWMERVFPLPEKPKRGEVFWVLVFMLGLGIMFFLFNEYFQGWFITISSIFGFCFMEWLHQNQKYKYKLSKVNPNEYYQLMLKERLELREYNARKGIYTSNYL